MIINIKKTICNLYLRKVNPRSHSSTLVLFIFKFICSTILITRNMLYPKLHFDFTWKFNLILQNFPYEVLSCKWLKEFYNLFLKDIVVVLLFYGKPEMIDSIGTTIESSTYEIFSVRTFFSLCNLNFFHGLYFAIPNAAALFNRIASQKLCLCFWLDLQPTMMPQKKE